MKILRSLYLTICYAVGLPILAVMLLIMVLVTMINDIIKEREFCIDYLREMISGAIDGLISGHKRNIEFVKYGRNYTKWFSEEQES